MDEVCGCGVDAVWMSCVDEMWMKLNKVWMSCVYELWISCG